MMILNNTAASLLGTLRGIGLLFSLLTLAFGCIGPSEDDTIRTVSIIGNQSSDLLGRSVAAVGRVNLNSGRQFTDILVGAPFFDHQEPFTDKGVAYLIFGKRFPPAAIAVSSTDPDTSVEDVSFVGDQAGGGLGFSVAGVGDVNGDGWDDFLIGAPFVRNPNNTSDLNDKNGVAYLVFGGELQKKLQACEVIPGCVGVDRMVVITRENGEKQYTVIMSRNNLEMPYINNDSNRPNPLFKLAFVLRAGTSQSNFGWSLAGVGDINGDGCPDFLIAAPFNSSGSSRNGAAYLYTGRGQCNLQTNLLESAVVADTPPLSPATTFTGMDLNDETLGLAVAGVGDINGDGKADLLMGAPTAPALTGSSNPPSTGCLRTGHAYLFLGSTPLPPSRNAADANVTLQGEKDKDCFGLALAGTGDINGDGRPDFIIGGPRSDGGGTVGSGQGSAYLFFGKSGFAASLNAVQADVVFQGSKPSEFFGSALTGSPMPWTGLPGGPMPGLWDKNGDGIADLAVGAYNASTGDRIRNGAVYLFYGGPSLTGTQKSSAAPLVFVGGEDKEAFGISIGLAGDFNGDKQLDLLIGSPFNDNNTLSDNGLAVLHLF